MSSMFSKLKKDAANRIKKKPERAINLETIAEPTTTELDTEEAQVDVEELEAVIKDEPIVEVKVTAPEFKEEVPEIDLIGKTFKFEAVGSYYSSKYKNYRQVTVEYDPVNLTAKIIKDEFVSHSPQMAMAIINKNLLFNISKRKFEV